MSLVLYKPNVQLGGWGGNGKINYSLVSVLTVLIGPCQNL